MVAILSTGKFGLLVLLSWRVNLNEVIIQFKLNFFHFVHYIVRWLNMQPDGTLHLAAKLFYFLPRPQDRHRFKMVSWQWCGTSIFSLSNKQSSCQCNDPRMMIIIIFFIIIIIDIIFMIVAIVFTVSVTIIIINVIMIMIMMIIFMIVLIIIMISIVVVAIIIVVDIVIHCKSYDFVRHENYCVK